MASESMIGEKAEGEYNAASERCLAFIKSVPIMYL